MDLVTKLAEYVVPAIIALLASTFRPALLTAAKHRRDLSSDTEILVGGLPSDVQTALRADMARRARLLITYPRPGITLPDLASLLGTLLLAVAGLHVERDSERRRAGRAGPGDPL